MNDEIENFAEELHTRNRRENPHHATNWRALKYLGYNQGYLRRARQILKRGEEHERS